MRLLRLGPTRETHVVVPLVLVLTISLSIAMWQDSFQQAPDFRMDARAALYHLGPHVFGAEYDLMVAPTRFVGGETTMGFRYANGEVGWAHAEFLYIDEPLSNTIENFPRTEGYVPVWESHGRKPMVPYPRPPVIIDTTVGCMRWVVSAEDLAPVSQQALDMLVAALSDDARQWYEALPEDPCTIRR